MTETSNRLRPATVHLIDAHLTYPGWSDGALTATLIDTATQHLESFGHTVTVTEVEAGYNPEEEVARYVDADLVILQTPINWFSAPWIYKRYADEVFNAGLHSRTLLDNDGRTRSDPHRQYGTGGHMHGRGFFVCSTWTAPADTFDNPDSVMFDGRRVGDLLLNLTANYRFTGFTVLDGFELFDIFHATTVSQRIDEYPAHIDSQLALLHEVNALGNRTATV